MKNLVIVLIASCLLFSCKKDSTTSVDKPFAIRDINGEQIKILPTGLLSSIYADLITKDRIEDANELLQQYDSKTGILNGYSSDIDLRDIKTNIGIDSTYLAVDTVKSIDNELKVQYEPHGVYAYCHIAGYGDRGPYMQALYYSSDYPSPFAGTTGESRRLEGMWLQTESSLSQTRPVIYYALCNPNYTWTNTATWGQFTGSRGQHRAVIGLKIWSPDKNYSIWYKAHNENTGWDQPWHNDGQFAGIYGKRLEAFAFHIIKY